MNNKTLKAFAVAALSVMAMACAKDPASVTGGETGVSFSVDVRGGYLPNPLTVMAR